MKGRITRPETTGDLNFQELGRLHIGMKSEKENLLNFEMEL